MVIKSSVLSSADPYISRIPGSSESAESVPREDPVVWGQADGPLSQVSLLQYERDGFLFMPSLFSPDEVDHLLAEAKSVIADWPEDRPGLVREPESDVVRSVFQLHRISRTFTELFRDQRLLAPVQQLLDSDVCMHQSRINYKPALDGKEFFWHSDFETWHMEDGMPRMRAISVSLFLTESHEFNGPLMLIPGSHRKYIRCQGETPENHFQQSLRRQQIGVPSAEALEELVRDGGIVAPKGPAGSVVLFDCNLMHGSAGNLSPNPRTNLFAVFNSVKNQLQQPFCSRPPRPEFLADRSHERVLEFI